VGALSRDTELVSQSRECARISLDAQRADGSWPYGASETLVWSDNFHTAYNLDSLLTLWLATGDGRVSATLAKGVEDWVERFFDANGAALYYRDGSGPLDIHCAATAVDTAARLSTHGYETLGIARGVRDAVSRTLLDPSTGATWFRRYRLLTDRRRFVRWGDAHWMLARSALASAEAGAPTPLEAAIRGAV